MKMENDFNNTELWKVFCQRAAYDHKFIDTVEEVCYSASLLSKTITQLFPSYTLHDGTHIVGVCNWIYKLICGSIDRLSLSNIALLIMSACCHDIGMAADQEQISKIKELLSNKSMESVKDYVRNNHHKRVKEQLDKYCTVRHDDKGSTISIWNENSMRHYGITKEVLSSICMSHGEDLSPISSPRPGEIDLNLCAVLLRIADALDFDSNRAPDTLFMFAGLYNPQNKADERSNIEYKKTSTGYFYLNPGGCLSLEGICYNKKIYDELMKYINWLKADVIKSFVHLSNYSKDWIGIVPTVIITDYFKLISDESDVQITANEDEERYEQFVLTMRQFTHELGQKSFSGVFCTSQLHEQIHAIEEVINSLPSSIAYSNAIVKGIKRIERTADDLESIFDGIGYLSQLARAKAGGLKYNPCKFDVRYAILNSLAAQYRIDIRGRGMNLVYEESLNNDHIVFGDKDLVNIAIHNLVSNAVKYGYPGTMVYYTCYKGYDEKGREGTFIDVTDYGIYIPEKERESIFEEGRHLGEARNDSMGFGLFLTRKIMDMHKGFCRVASSKIVSKYSLPNLEEMIAYKDSIPVGIDIDMNDVINELSIAKGYPNLYDKAVYRKIKVSSDTEPVITKRSVFIDGKQKMAETVMQLFFPEEDSNEKDTIY